MPFISKSSFRLTAVVVLVGVVCLAAMDHSPPKPASRVRLAVLVVFDQLRADYLERWQALFEERGFRRLQRDGAWFQNCHYPYGHTFTAPGHASLLTGCSPVKHGIVENDWYDRKSETLVYCVADRRYERVPAPPGERTGLFGGTGGGGASPRRLLVPTVGDVLKEATQGKARIVALSMKDRSAVLPAGSRADACYWFDTSGGQFVTSTYYRGTLHSWVAEFNRERPATRWLGGSWTKLLPDLDYERYSGPDDVEGEGRGLAKERTFPHPLSGRQQVADKQYYEAVYSSPFGNDLLLQLAERAIDAEKLGQRDVADLLVISFSANDAVGHRFGPDSQEVLDVTLRSDLIVRDLLAYLDTQVGPQRYVLALTADHGVCPLPEVAAKSGQAGRMNARVLARQIEAFLNEKYGERDDAGPWLVADQPAGPQVYPWIYLNRRALIARRLASAEVEQTLAHWLPRQRGIEAAYTRTDFMQGPLTNDHLGESIRRSFYPDRCGDVALVPKPYFIFWSPLGTGTTHGTPHLYDTHVPLLVYGPGIRGGARKEAVAPQAISAIFAYYLGITTPAAAEVPLPETLFRGL